MSEPKVSVVIPAYNAAGTIGAQLEALRRQEGAPAFEVIVADNRSNDGTAEAAVAEGEDLDLRIVSASRAQGVNCARNEGAVAAQAEIIVFIDADDVAGPKTLSAFAAAMEASPQVDIVSGVPLSVDATKYALPVAQRYLPYGLGGFMAVRRTAFERVGGFDEAFVGGHDEVDFCWRVQQTGGSIAVAREARFAYEPRRDARSTFHQYRRYGKTYIQLFVKHREQGIQGSSLRIERHDLKRVAVASMKLLLRQGSSLEHAQRLGWIVGRWQGNIHYRVWGPR